MPDFEITPGTDETIGRIDTPYCDPDDFADEPRAPRARRACRRSSACGTRLTTSSS